MVETANNIWADGSPTDPYEPDKRQIREWGTWVEGSITAFLASGGKVYATRAALYADLSQTANTMAWVISDPTAANNGIYRKNGAANTGSWTRLGDLPYSFIVATDSGAGTPNAIQATSSIPISGSALVIMNVFEDSVVSPVTVSFNGGSPLTIKTNSGSDIAPGGLVAGMQLLGVVSGSTFRLVSDQVSSAIIAQAEDAADRAETAADLASQYAALALNNFVRNTFTGDGTQTDFALSIDPGSANNMFVNINGVLQAISAYSLQYVATVPTLRFSSPPPNGVEIDVRFGSKIAVGVPADGTITTPKIGGDAVTADKMSGSDAANIRAKIGAAASGTPITNAQMPTGSVVQSVLASAITNAALTATIPRDNTIPQVTEGTEVLNGKITPRSATNKVRVRMTGWFEASAVLHVIGAICSSTQTDAIGAMMLTSQATAGYGTPMAFEAEFVPGTTSEITISFRAGPADATPGTVRFASASASHFLGAAGKTTLVIEEIKV